MSAQKEFRSKTDATYQSKIMDKRRKFRAFEQNKERELTEQQIHRRYYHAKQWTDAEKKKLEARGQPAIVDNRIGRKVDFLVGVEQRMRRDPKAFPRTSKATQSADLATSGLRYICDNNRWEIMTEAATLKGMVSGIGGVYIGLEEGPQGLDPKVKPVEEDRFFYDPRSVQKDFSDARFMGVHLWMDVAEAQQKFPKHAVELAEVVNADSIGEGSGFVAEEDRDEQWGDFEHSRVRIVEFWEKKVVPPYNKDVWTYCFFTGHIDLDSGTSPFKDEDGLPDVPFCMWSAYVDEKGDRYGPIRNMMSMQDEINHRRSKFLHSINTRQVRVRKDSEENIDHIRMQLARPDGVVEHDSEWGVDIDIIDNGDIAQGQALLLEQSQAALENLGPNPGLIGKGGGVADQSGRAILAQRDSGMTELSPVFQQIRDWKIRCYRKMLGRSKQAWTNEREIRITDDEGQPQFIGLNQYSMDPVTGQFSVENQYDQVDVDIILDEGPDTITMNEELLQTLSQMGEAALGPMGRVVIELSNVANKEKLIKMLDRVQQPDPQVQQLEQRFAMLEMAEKEANVEKTQAEVVETKVDSVTKLVEAMTPPDSVEPSFQQVSSPRAPGPPSGVPAQGNALQAQGELPLPITPEIIPPEQALPLPLDQIGGI
jgi:hypothetical protein